MPVTVGGNAITPTQAEQLRVALSVDGEPVTTVKPTPVGADRIIVLDSAASFAPVLVDIEDLPTGAMTAAQIRDSLQTLTTTNRLDASAIRNLPTVSAGSPVTITHNGGGANPAAGDTVTASFSAGYSGTVQWTRNGSNIGGATSPTYLLTGTDSGTTVAAVVTSLIYTATGLSVTAGATAPAAMTAGQWTAEATSTAGQMGINIVTLPSNGGSAITALEYRVGAGAAIALTGTGTGLRTVTAGFTAGVAVDIQVRAVNAVGAGAWSDTKNRTPLASGGSLAIVQAPTPTVVIANTVISQSISAVGSGNSLVIAVFSPTSGGAPTISDSAGGTWSSVVHSYAGAEGNTVRFYTRANITNAPTSVSATFSGGVNGWIQPVEVSGAGSAISLDASGGAAQGTTTAYNFAFTSTVANTLFIGAASLTNNATPTGVAPVTAVGLDGDYNFAATGIFPTAGSNTATVNLASGRNGDRFWAVFRAGA